MSQLSQKQHRRNSSVSTTSSDSSSSQTSEHVNNNGQYCKDIPKRKSITGMSIFDFGIGKALKKAKNGSSEELSRILSKRPHFVNAKNKGGTTCLHIACWKGDMDMVMMLLMRGADINSADKKGYNALLISIERDFHEIARMLIDRGAQVMHRNCAHCTPLHVAAQSDCAAIVHALLDSGADINAVDVNGFTPLNRAVRMGHVDIAVMLVNRRADLTIKDKSGASPAELARKFNLLGLIKVLEQQFALDKVVRARKEESIRMRESMTQGPGGGRNGSGMMIGSGTGRDNKYGPMPHDDSALANIPVSNGRSTRTGKGTRNGMPDVTNITNGAAVNKAMKDAAKKSFFGTFFGKSHKKTKGWLTVMCGTNKAHMPEDDDDVPYRLTAPGEEHLQQQQPPRIANGGRVGGDSERGCALLWGNNGSNGSNGSNGAGQFSGNTRRDSTGRIVFAGQNDRDYGEPSRSSCTVM